MEDDTARKELAKTKYSNCHIKPNERIKLIRLYYCRKTNMRFMTKQLKIINDFYFCYFDLS